MRDLTYNEFLDGILKLLNFYCENWEIWVFYVLGYTFVLFYTNKALTNLNGKVQDTYNGSSKHLLLYLSIKIALRELRDSESKVFYAFVIATIIINIYSLFEPLTKLDSIPKDDLTNIKFVGFIMLIAYNGLIYVIPNYSRYKTFKKLYKTFV